MLSATFFSLLNNPWVPGSIPPWPGSMMTVWSDGFCAGSLSKDGKHSAFPAIVNKAAVILIIVLIFCQSPQSSHILMGVIAIFAAYLIAETYSSLKKYEP